MGEKLTPYQKIHSVFIYVKFLYKEVLVVSYLRHKMNDYDLWYERRNFKSGLCIELCIEICGLESDHECHNVTIPEEIEGLPVRIISESAFYNHYSFKTVKLPEGLAVIGDSAFQRCECLTDINFPDSLITIGDSAFSCCDLRIANFGYNLKTIDASAFANNQKLKSVKFQEKLKTIKGFAFENCGIVSMTLPDSLTHLDFSAFDGCEDVESLHIGAGLATNYYDRTIGGACCRPSKITVSEKNENFKIINKCLYDMRTKELVRVPSHTNVIIIPKWVKSITPECFSGIYPDKVVVRCENLEYIAESYIENAKTVYCVPDSSVEKFLKESGTNYDYAQSSISTFLNNISEEKNR